VDAPLLRAPFDWDEANYVAAARMGVAANLLERGSMAPGDFLRMAQAKRAGAPYEPPAGYDEARDPLLRRHYHPPAVVAALALLPTHRERIPRLAQLLAGAAFVVLVIQLYLRVSRGPTAAGLVAIAALASWAAALGFGALSFHGWEAAAALVAAVAAGRWLETGRTRDLVIAGLAIGASLLILGTGIYVVAAVAGTLMFAAGGATRRERLRAIAKAVAIAAVTVVVLWPGTLLRASALKIPAFHLYRAHIGSEFGAVSSRLPVVAAAMAPLAAGVLCALLAKRPWSAPIVGLLAIGTAYTIGLIPVALMPVYLVPGAIAFGLAGACAIDSRPPELQVAGLLAIAASIGWSAWTVVPELSTRLVREDIDRMVARVDGRRAFVDGAHIYDLYLDGRARLTPLAVSFDGETYTVRERGHYRPLTPEDMAGSLIAAQQKRVRRDQTPRALAGCRDLGETEQLRWFDCALPP
jgi:hypothetical protein